MCITLTWKNKKITTVVRCWQQVATDDADSEEDSTDEEFENSEEEDEAHLVQERPEAIALYMGVSLFPERLLVGNKYYPRAYMDYLQLRERQKCQPKILHTYFGLGSERRC